MGAKPTHKILAKSADDHWVKVGVAWVQSNGKINMALDPFIVLHDQPKMIVVPFEQAPGSYGKGAQRAARLTEEEIDGTNDDGDFPFD